MAQPFTDLPDPDELAPPGAAPRDPATYLAALGYNAVGERIDPNDVARRVAEHDARQLAEGTTPSPPHWRIEDEQVAEWAMAKLAQARHELAVADRRRSEYTARIDQWYVRSVDGPRRDAAFFEGHLILWALTQRSESKGATKTLLLPSGEVRTRKPGPWKPAIDDSGALLEWAIGQRDAGRPGLVRSRLLLDVLVAALQDVAMVVGAASTDSDVDEYVVVDRETGERIPGAIAKRTESSPTVVSYETE